MFDYMPEGKTTRLQTSLRSGITTFVLVYCMTIVPNRKVRDHFPFVGRIPTVVANPGPGAGRFLGGLCYFSLVFLARRNNSAALKLAEISTRHPLVMTSPGSGESRGQVSGLRLIRL